MKMLLEPYRTFVNAGASESMLGLVLWILGNYACLVLLIRKFRFQFCGNLGLPPGTSGFAF